MDRNEQFSKWMQAVEEALSNEKKEIAESMPVTNECGCGSWDCPQCFPDQDEAPGGAKPAVIAVVGGGCPACGQGADVCPACGQPHANAQGQMSPMSIPPGEVETEIGMAGAEFDGELEELSEPTLNSYRDKAIGQFNDPSVDLGKRSSREIGIDQVNDRLGIGRADQYKTSDEMDPGYGGDDFDEPYDDYQDNGPYGGRNDDFYSNLTARGFEEEAPPEMPDAPAERPSNGKAGVKLGHIVQHFEPVGTGADDAESPLTHGEDNLGENGYDEFDREPTDDQLHDIENSSDPFVNPQAANQDVEAIMYMQDMGLSMSDTRYDERELYTLTPEQLQQVKAEVMGGQTPPGPAVQEDDMMADMGAGGAPAATGGSVGAAPSSGGGAGNYAPGTAPTMPESIQRGNTMENIDSDIARVMKGFSDYDKLKASKAVVSEKSAFDWKDEKKEDDKKEDKTSKTHKGGEVTKTETGLKHKGTYGGDKEVKESAETADVEVLEWMQRFAKLGRMG